MKKSKNTQISAIPPLRPQAIWDTSTGVAVSLAELQSSIQSLVTFVQKETLATFQENPEQVIQIANNLKGSANSYGRQQGYKSAALELPREVLAKSRLNELYLYKLMSEVASYARNPNPKKQHPSFPLTVNLGAVDKQMASLSRENEILTLKWKCWDTEYLIDFIIPAYITKRDIKKYSLPLVRYTSKGYEFIFSIQENTPILPASKLSAGFDSGRVEPITLAIVNKKGNRIAHYTSSGRLKELNTKREDILNHKRHVWAKIDQYDALGLSTETLTIEKDRLGNKARILGHVVAQQVGNEIAQKLLAHKVNTLNVENLSWATGAKYGSKWNHSAQQEAITHAVKRNGVRVKKISPKNSSQLCHSCGSRLTHSGRVARCADCQTTLNRDLVASLNLASSRHLTKRYPSLDNNRLAGDDRSAMKKSFMAQVIDHTDHSSNPKLVLVPK